MRIPVEDVVHGMQLKGIPVKEVRVCKQMAELIGRDKVCGVPVVVVNVPGQLFEVR
jgi:hypothetical protein